jgi:hypothetical protein
MNKSREQSLFDDKYRENVFYEGKHIGYILFRNVMKKHSSHVYWSVCLFLTEGNEIFKEIGQTPQLVMCNSRTISMNGETKEGVTFIGWNYQADKIYKSREEVKREMEAIYVVLNGMKNECIL